MALTSQCHALDVKVKQLDLYEPDPIHYDIIKNMKWSDAVEKVQIFKETIEADTKYPRKYDWIILRHVFYHFLTEVSCKNYSNICKLQFILFLTGKMSRYL